MNPFSLKRLSTAFPCDALLSIHKCFIRPHFTILILYTANLTNILCPSKLNMFNIEHAWQVLRILKKLLEMAVSGTRVWITCLDVGMENLFSFIKFSITCFQLLLAWVITLHRHYREQETIETYFIHIAIVNGIK